MKISEEQEGKLKNKQCLVISVQQTLEVFELYQKMEMSGKEIQQPVAEAGNKQQETEERKQFATQTQEVNSVSKVVECSILVPKEQVKTEAKET